jgi:opacity protein-like surface antigen
MKKIINSAVCIFSVLWMLSGNAFAGKTVPFYFGLSGGYTLGSDLEFAVDDYDFDLDIDNKWTLGIKLGYTMPFARFLAVEAEALYFDPEVNDQAWEKYGSYNVDVDATIHFYNLLFNVIVKYPDGRIHPYLGAGAGLSHVDFYGEADNTYSTNADLNNDRDTTFAWQVLAGVNFDINESLSADLAYRYFSTSAEFSHDNEIDYTTSMITVGLNFHF